MAGFDDMPFIKKPNPLGCGCSIIGVQGVNIAGTMTEWRNLQIKFCPLHAAAPELLEVCKSLLSVVAIQNGNLHKETNQLQELARNAIAKTERAKP